MTKAVLGIIGGSGFYDLPGMVDMREEKISSPWGEPSDTLRLGRIGERRSSFYRGMAGPMHWPRPTSIITPISTY